MKNEASSVNEYSSAASTSSQHEVEDDKMIAIVLSEEYDKLDGRVGQCLSTLAPVPVRCSTVFG